MEICPNCGVEVAKLSGVTGWCKLCSRNNRHCDCGRRLDATHNECSECRRGNFDDSNLERLKDLLDSGLSLDAARKQISDEKRPTCISCGVGIKMGGPTSKFCRSTKRCRDARNKYRYQTLKKGVTPEKAVTEILKWLTKQNTAV